MADIDFPAGLPKALASAYTSTQAAAFIESEAASGGFYVKKLTDDIFAAPQQSKPPFTGSSEPFNQGEPTILFTYSLSRSFIIVIRPSL